MERAEKNSQRAQSRSAADAALGSRAAPIADFRPASVAQRALAQAAGLDAAPVQRAGPEDELQMKADPVQRAGPEDDLQMKADPLQRAGEEDELQMKADPLQRAAEEEPEPQL